MSLFNFLIFCILADKKDCRLYDSQLINPHDGYTFMQSSNLSKLVADSWGKLPRMRVVRSKLLLWMYRISKSYSMQVYSVGVIRNPIWQDLWYNLLGCKVSLSLKWYWFGDICILGWWIASDVIHCMLSGPWCWYCLVHQSVANIGLSREFKKSFIKWYMIRKLTINWLDLGKKNMFPILYHKTTLWLWKGWKWNVRWAHVFRCSVEVNMLVQG